MQVRDLKIDDEYIVVSNDMTITQISKEIAKSGIPDAVVINEENIVIGALDIYDIVSKVLAVELDPKTTHAEKIMYSFPSVNLNTEINRVQEIMNELQIGMIPVVDADKKLLGVVSTQDILIAMAQMKKKDRSLIRQLALKMR